MKEPIYMKWWAWIGVFILTAFVVNYTTDDSYEIIAIKYDNNIDSALAEPTDLEESLAVIAITKAYEQENSLFDYSTPTTFLVGTDIPTGEYFVMTSVSDFGYVLLTRSQTLNVHEIIWQKHFENHAIINLLEGEYLTIKNATLIPIDDAIVPNFESGTLQSGTYRVGIDIPPGIYTLFPLENKTGFFEVAASSHHLEAHINQRRNFTEPITIALNIGDYLTLMRAEIKK